MKTITRIRNKQKIISIVILLAMALSVFPVFAEGEILTAVSLSDVSSAYQGSTVTVELTLNNPLPIVSMDFFISYDASKFEQIAKTDVDWNPEIFEKKWTANVNAKTSGQLYIFAVSSDLKQSNIQNKIPPIKLADITFKVKRDANPGKVDLTFAKGTKLWQIDQTGENVVIDFARNNGSINIVKKSSGGYVDSEAGKKYATTEPAKSPEPTESPKPTETPTQTDGPKGVESFRDVGNAHEWARGPIDALVKAGIINGTSATTFEPDRSITRAEFCKLIVTALKLNDVDENQTYADVSSNDWYYSSVMAAAKAGIVTGYPEGNFKPNATITREEMAAVLVRALGSAGLPVPKGDVTFADRDEMGEWAINYIAGLAQLGIVGGRGDNRFVPRDNLTRAESAKVIYTSLTLLSALTNNAE